MDKKQSIDGLKAKAKGLRSLLSQVESISGVGNVSERSRDAERKSEKRKKQRLVVIPKCEDPARRKRLEADTVAWLMWYFAAESDTPDPFWYEFQPQQRRMINAIDEAIAKGQDKAEAASRGEGKTIITQRVGMKHVLCGTTKFIALLGATKGHAQGLLTEIKNEFECNVRLRADYPEVCYPVLALESAVQKARTQIVSGHRHDNGEAYTEHGSKFSWCGPMVQFPDVPGSPSSGTVIMVRGLDTAVRGLRYIGKRPDTVIIDDPDTEESAESEKAAAKLERRIDRALSALGGQRRRAARVMLTTLQSRISVSYKYTDRKKKPSWRGDRARFLLHPPERVDMWDEYVTLKRLDWENETTKAHEFYLANRKAMDRGAVVANVHRFTPDESSALEFYYSEVARLQQEAVDTEYNNDPPEVAAPIESQLTAHRVQKQLSNFPRKVIPPGCEVLSMGVDVRKSHLHWVVRAWRRDGQAYYTIDYGIQEVIGTTRGKGTDVGVELAIYKAIRQRWDEWQEADYQFDDGSTIPESARIALVDAGWQTTAVYAACKSIGAGIFPSMGFGKSSGCVGVSFREHEKSTEVRKPGDHWFLSKKQITDHTIAAYSGLTGRKDIWLVCVDADYWKQYEHERWLTDEGEAGRMLIFGERSEEAERMGRLSDDSKRLQNYGHHIVAEALVEEVIRGKLMRRWKGSGANHLLDASALASCGASMRGIRLLAGVLPIEQQTKPKAAGGKPVAKPHPKKRVWNPNE